MERKSVILSKKEADLLHTLIEKHGLIVTSGQIFDILKKGHTKQQVYNTTTKLAAAGWLVRLRRGLYYITSLESRGQAELSQLVIAQLLDTRAYISCEAALQYHGMFDQLLSKVVCVTTASSKTRIFQDTQYRYTHTEDRYFFGFTKEYIENQEVKIATAEKALIDMLHGKRSVYAVDMVLEKIREYRDSLDMNKLIFFAKRDTLTVQRILGFVLDIFGIDTTELSHAVENKRGYSRMTCDQEHSYYNAKWHVYYHKHFKDTFQTT